MGRLFDSTKSQLIRYGDFRFPPTSEVNLRAVPVKDSSGRAVKYKRYNLTISCILSYEDFNSQTTYGSGNAAAMGLPAADTDPTKQSAYLHKYTTKLACYLTDRGRQFVMVNSGSGFYNITDQDDVTFGPHGMDVSINPISPMHVKLHWSAEFTVACCDSPTMGAQTAIGEFCYSINFTVAEGTLTRTISGTAETYVTLTPNGRKVTSSADGLRDIIFFPTLPGFIRTSDFNISQDRRTLSFSITDSEIPSDNPYYPGVIRQNITHSIRSSLSDGAYGIWHGSFSGSITVAPGYPKSIAVPAFFWIVYDRIIALAKNYNTANTASLAGIATPSQLTAPQLTAITAISITEEIFTRTTSFEMSYSFTSNLSDILKNSQVWKPAYLDQSGTQQELSWSDWTASMTDVFSNFGPTSVRHFPSDDLIVTFCTPYENPSPPQSNVTGSKTGTLIPIGGQTTNPPNSGRTSGTKPTQNQGNGKKQPVSVDGGYLTFFNQFIVTREQRGTRHFPLGKGDSEVSTSIDTTDDQIELGIQLPINDEPGSTNNPNKPIFNDSAGLGQVEITMTGSATRVNVAPVIPKIVQVGGLPAVMLRQQISAPRVVARTADGKNIWGASWTIVYLVYTTDTSNITFKQPLPNVPQQQPNNP